MAGEAAYVSPSTLRASETNYARGIEIASRGVGRALCATGLTVAIAESLTGGLLASTFAAMKGAGQFFRGGVVAYASDVKFELLGVTPGPVVNQRTADDMAKGALRLFAADFAFGVTGVGGPGNEESWPAGTVFMALWFKDGPAARQEFHFPGSPEEVCRATCLACLDSVESVLIRKMK